VVPDSDDESDGQDDNEISPFDPSKTSAQMTSDCFTSKLTNFQMMITRS